MADREDMIRAGIWGVVHTLDPVEKIALVYWVGGDKWAIEQEGQVVHEFENDAAAAEFLSYSTDDYEITLE